MDLRFQIGRFYRRIGTNHRFQLKSASRFVFHFSCGHWCTDCVFMNYEDADTFQPCFIEYQLELF